MKSRFSIVIVLSLFLYFPLYAGTDEFRAISRLSFYTTESTGQVLVLVPEIHLRETITIDLVHREQHIVRGFPLQEGFEADLVPFRLQEFREGKDTLVCSFYVNNKWLSSVFVEVYRLPWKSNEVKIDHFSGGLVVDGMPFFPFGFYCRTPVHPTLPEEEAVKGFNMISPYQLIEKKTLNDRRAYMDRCAVLGMKVHYQLLSLAGGGGVNIAGSQSRTAQERKQLLRDEVMAFRDHPALLAWYIADEPDGQGVIPDSLLDAYKTIKELDPWHPVTIVFMTPSRAHEYEKVMDIVMADPYPVPNSPLTEVSEWTQQLQAEFYPEKPVWIVPQAFGGAEWWKREPTSREIRVMTYLAVIHRASGIQYFIRHGLNRFPKSQAMWAECGSMALELAEVAPYLSFSTRHPDVKTSAEAIRAGAWMNRGEILLIAVNTSSSPMSYEVALTDVDFTGEADVLFENRKVAAVRGKLKDVIDGLGTRVYRVILEPLFDRSAGIQPFNLTVDPGFEESPEAGIPSACYAWREGDRGATYFTDTRTSYQGYRSLRLVTPETNQGVQLSFYPVQLQKGRSYSLSVWAKAGKPVSIEEKKCLFKRITHKKDRQEAQSRFKLSLGSSSQVFALEGEWRKYTVLVPALDEGIPLRLNPGLELLSRGTAWFDLLEVIPDILIKSVPRPGEEGLQIELSSTRPAGEIRFTVDGTQPDTLSSLYQGPFMIRESCRLKAAIFNEGRQDGYVETELLVHKGTGMTIRYTNPYSNLYTGGGDEALLDGKRGTVNYKDGLWQGFLKKDMEVVIDLGEEVTVNTVITGFLQDQGTWIFLPLEVSVSLSLTGSDEIQRLTSAANDALKPGPRKIKDFTVSFGGVQARYVKIVAKSPGLCPAWHKGSGKPAWIFCDEVIIE
jgi:hypothetical protein